MHPNAHDDKEKKPNAHDDKEKKKYPAWRYHAQEKQEEQPKFESKLVNNEDEEKELQKEGGWVESPADLGIETAPGVAPDPAIAAKGKPPAPSGNPPAPEPKKAK